MMPAWRRLLKAKRRPLGGLGDLSIAAHRDGSVGTFVIRFRHPGTGKYFSLQSGYSGQPYFTIYEVDDPAEYTLQLDEWYLPDQPWNVAWQIRVEVWGEPTATSIRFRAWRSTESPGAWLTATGTYGIPRSDGTFTQDATIDSVERLYP
jgi:hypothetical protein